MSVKEYNAKYYSEHKEKAKEYYAKYYAKHNISDGQIETNRIKARNAYRLKKGIPLDAPDTRGGAHNVKYASKKEALKIHREQLKKYRAEHREHKKEYNARYYAEKKQKKKLLIIDDEDDKQIFNRVFNIILIFS